MVAVAVVSSASWASSRASSSTWAGKSRSERRSSTARKTSKGWCVVRAGRGARAKRGTPWWCPDPAPSPPPIRPDVRARTWALAILQRVERDREGEHEPPVDRPPAGVELEDVAVAQLAEHALVTA